jgi:putative glutamine amidotransferase
MGSRPLVGVTGSARRWAPAWWCAKTALTLAGASAMRISTRHGDAGKTLDALIIGGGNDISPEHYDGEITGPVAYDPDRDLLEIRWIRHALAYGIPLLGICRGAQLINVVLGGDLHPDIRNLRHLTYNRPGLMPTKQVALEPGSHLARICGKSRIRVNSLHHQAIKTPGKGLKVVGRDLDGIVQAVETEGAHRIIGVQWHPEYLLYVPAQFALFRWLVRKEWG